jgi:hypothetical protein
MFKACAKPLDDPSDESHWSSNKMPNRIKYLTH